MEATTKQLECDYLVVGAGASSLAFVDTLLTELPDIKVILVDKKTAPGGHWLDAYGFVRLHQPSLVYGVASRQLEGHWGRLMLTKFQLPWNHRATKQEIITYFGSYVNDKIGEGRLEFYPGCAYNFESGSEGMFSFSTLDGETSYRVKVNAKVVNGLAGSPIIPSVCPLQFPVDGGINVFTPNQVYDASLERQSAAKAKLMKYVVLGAGKTAMDCIVYLQKKMSVKASNIAWVIPNDVWIVKLDGGGNPWVWPRYLLKNDLDFDRAAEALEANGMFVRLDTNVKPTRFRYAVVPNEELKLLRNIKTIIRRGRATAIRRDGNDVLVEFADGKPAWKAIASADQCTFVHATSPGPFNGLDIDDLFVSEKQMTLNLLTAPPISSSMSTLAKLEAARSKQTLDLDFARHLFVASKGGSESTNLDGNHSDNDMLRALVRGLQLSGKFEPVKPIVTLAIVLAIMDKDPMEGYKWMKGNRLCFFSIPGFKGEIYEDIVKLCQGGERMGFSKNDIQMFELLATKLKPLEGL